MPGLTYANLSVDMSFDIATPTYKTFVFDAQHILLDSATSQARSASLASHFPMKLTGLYQATGTVTPDGLGYMPVDSPLQGSQLTAPWFGLQYDLDLGSPGALAAQVNFTARLLLAWSPNPATASVYVGLGLPGVSGGQRAMSLQGVLSLAFGTVTFLVQPPTYILELSNIVLKFLSLSFPHYRPDQPGDVRQPERPDQRRARLVRGLREERGGPERRRQFQDRAAAHRQARAAARAPHRQDRGANAMTDVALAVAPIDTFSGFLHTQGCLNSGNTSLNIGPTSQLGSPPIAALIADSALFPTGSLQMTLTSATQAATIVLTGTVQGTFLGVTNPAAVATFTIDGSGVAQLSIAVGMGSGYTLAASFPALAGSFPAARASPDPPSPPRRRAAAPRSPSRGRRC